MSGWMPIERNSLTECWVGLVFTSPADGNIGQQRQVDIDAMVMRQVVAELADRLQKRHGLDVADRAADLDQDEIMAGIAVEDEFLDGVGDMGNHLHRAAEIIAAPLAGDDVLIDSPGGDIVLPDWRSGR